MGFWVEGLGLRVWGLEVREDWGCRVCGSGFACGVCPCGVWPVRLGVAPGVCAITCFRV